MILKGMPWNGTLTEIGILSVAAMMGSYHYGIVIKRKKVMLSHHL